MENDNLKLKNVSKRYWLRGGILGLIIGLFISVIFLGVNCTTGFGGPSGDCNSSFSMFIASTKFIVILPVLFLISAFKPPLDSMNFYYFITILSFALLFSVIGVTAGWIYGKIKNRKSHAPLEPNA